MTPVSPWATITGRYKPWMIALVVGLCALYLTGSLDKALVHVGLNYDECARNLITGAYFCGDELDQLREQQRELRRQFR